MRLNPMTFIEFLMATGDDALACFLSYISTLDPVPRTCFYPLFEKLKLYFVTGGMPKSVLLWTRDQDGDVMQTALFHIIESCEGAFARHADGKDYDNISVTWNPVSARLTRQKWYLFKAVKNGARAREYEGTPFCVWQI